ncbi:MAG: hypothetical protein IPJ81_14455 [Chitinophagaceae bacterium]|nr:hypothetical protein [Chitinophagaceae bacterium]
MNLRDEVDILKSNSTINEINGWLSSYIHMSINRLFKSKSRLHEFILYEIINRLYISNSWKNKKKC